MKSRPLTQHVPVNFHFKVFLFALLGITAAAVAHHGNPQAPASSSWYGYLPPGSAKPAAPALPGQ